MKNQEVLVMKLKINKGFKPVSPGKFIKNNIHEFDSYKLWPYSTVIDSGQQINLQSPKGNWVNIDTRNNHTVWDVVIKNEDNAVEKIKKIAAMYEEYIGKELTVNIEVIYEERK
jgi:hypothetical protein